MKKWLMTMVVLLSAVAANATTISDSRKANLMALPPFERACVLIRHYETLHKPKHWPTIAYGHVVQKGENYRKRQYSHAEADRILRKDLSRLCAYYRGYGADSLLLACLAYNVVKAKFPAMYNAFCYGAPPHAGIAPGVDRMVMLLAGEDSIREIIPFPMNKNAQDIMMDAPSEVTQKQLDELHIAITAHEEE